MSYVSHLEGALDGTRLEARQIHTLHRERPIWVRYHLDRGRAEVDRDALARRPPSIWRWGELLPVEHANSIVTLGEGMTPLLSAPRLGDRLGLTRLFIKDDSQLPTGSFKSL